jgi:hypothetical protein
MNRRRGDVKAGHVLPIGDMMRRSRMRDNELEKLGRENCGVICKSKAVKAVLNQCSNQLFD